MHVANPAFTERILAKGMRAQLRGLGRSGWVQAMGYQHHGDDFRGRHERGHLELGKEGLCSFICHQASGVRNMTWHEGLTHYVDLVRGVDRQQSAGGSEDDILVGDSVTIKLSNLEAADGVLRAQGLLQLLYT